MKNAVPAFRFRFSLVDDALKLLVESCRNTADFVTPVLIVPYVTDVSTENSLALAAPSMCRRTFLEIHRQVIFEYQQRQSPSLHSSKGFF